MQDHLLDPFENKRPRMLAFDIKPLLCVSTDISRSGLTSAKFTRCPNSAIRADCCDSSGASKTNALGGNFEVRAPMRCHFTAPRSS